MKSTPKQSDEYTAFQSLLRRVLQASHTDIKAELDKEKATRKAAKVSDPASCEKD